MSDFNQAIQWLKEGKEVSARHYERSYLIMNYNYFECIDKVDGHNYKDWKFNLADFEATDWEIYEEIKLEVGDIVKANEKCKKRYIGKEGKVIEIIDNKNISVLFPDMIKGIGENGSLFERDCLIFVRKPEKTLSEEIENPFEDCCGSCNGSAYWHEKEDPDFFRKEKVKECFDKIKKEFPQNEKPEYPSYTSQEIIKIINKHIGPKLI